MDVTALSDSSHDKQFIEHKLLCVYSASPSPRLGLDTLIRNMHIIYDALHGSIFSSKLEAIREYELITMLSAPSQSWSEISTVALFEKHFLTRFCLYFIAKYSERLTLDIQLVAIHVALKHASSHKHVGSFTPPALEAFYFDWSQFNHVTEHTVNTLLIDFWMRYRHNQSANQDLALLHLSQPLNVLTVSQIKHAYRIQAQKHHPDKGGNSDVFHALEQAYRRLIKLKT